MRFRALSDARTVSLTTYFAILLFNVYTLSLYYNQQLTFYIHPRYITFTVALNAISLVACAVGFLVAAWRMGTATSKSTTAVASPGSSPGSSLGSSLGSASSGGWRPSFTVLVAGLVLVAAYALPARTLSSGTADHVAPTSTASRLNRPVAELVAELVVELVAELVATRSRSLVPTPVGLPWLTGRWHST